MKIFKGYLILGVASKKEAENKTGLLIWCKNKPSKFKLYFLQKLLSIFWIDEYKEHHKKDKFNKVDEVQLINR